MIFEAGISVGIKSLERSGIIEELDLESGKVVVKMGDVLVNTVLDDLTKHNKTVKGLYESVYIRVEPKELEKLNQHNSRASKEEQIKYERVDTTTALFTSYAVSSLKDNGKYFADRELKDEEILDIIDSLKQELEGDWIGEQLNELVDDEILDAIKRTPLFDIE